MTSAGTVVDGRSLRAERTRTALAAAYLDLLTEGDLRPTAERIAERAGCSPRSVFKHFPDREALFAAASKVQEERVLELMGDSPDPEAPLDERLDAFVEQRTRFHEFVTPVRRAALLTEPFSETIAEKLTMARSAGAAQVAHVFQQELDPLHRRAKADMLAALTAIAAWPTWESLRKHQGLPADRASTIMRSMLSAQLKSAP
jgi:TetR/AcrR family transcriptional regulator, regulator of autoinduction and epiphytic fitness